MVTEAEELKDLYVKEFIEILRSRPSHPEFVKIKKKLKDLIFNLKIEKAKNKKSNDWTMKDLDEKEDKVFFFLDPKAVQQWHFNLSSDNQEVIDSPSGYRAKPT